MSNQNGFILYELMCCMFLTVALFELTLLEWQNVHRFIQNRCQILLQDLQ